VEEFNSLAYSAAQDLMHERAFLYGTTTSCDRPVEVRLREPHPTGIQAPIHAPAWMRIAEKKPSTHSGE